MRRAVRWGRGAHWARAVRWYLRELTGESEYDRYCLHRQRHDPDAPLPTRREYQLLRTRHQETRTHSRCC
ncbi:CstA-like transporter-associated (seleno)protein [Streptomyces sp. NPDC007929]|uniref:YbdD/YjiX family protein n=1 Tax=unclassified Streptomyces TaxID=2593676 RepID=UPI0036EBD897